MKTVGIMSMQRIYNYGSFLQGYALKRLIEMSDQNIEVQFLDYRPGDPLIKTDIADRKNSFSRKISKIKEYNQVNAKLIDKIRFFNHKRTYANRFFPLLGLTEQPNYNYNVDVQVIGSDEVFNCVQSNSNVGFSRDLFGHNSEAKKVISYAGSFGNTTYEKINEYSIGEMLKEDFQAFAQISVRDENSRSVIEKLTGNNPSVNVDPVLAYDYMKLESKIPKNRLFKDKYIIVYGYSGRLTSEENKMIKEYARNKGAKVICIGGVQDCCDKFIDCDPFEVLAYFRDADSIVTDTFHGTIFSIINNKQFCTIIRKSVGNSYGNEEKLGYLLGLFGLDSQRSDNLTLDGLSSILSNEIDYDSVNKKLNLEREKAINYLKSNI
ncbi:polysaccharide pyruvyl transferase family protein [Niallia circulans]|uniref:polysaccharide pyruvyl transferase family protein n=1 Tax=Niallia circulans TaxID=1397 RepID=UPI0026F05AFA|nr:polysaccharide pyruvyl transferase family protein [Niallia circulans]